MKQQFILSDGNWKLFYVEDGINESGFYWKNAGDPQTSILATNSGIADKITAELARMTEERDEAQASLRFYDGLIVGDGDHDKTMLAIDGSVFLSCMKALGMDVSGADIQEIPEAIIRMKHQLHNYEVADEVESALAAAEAK